MTATTAAVEVSGRTDIGLTRRRNEDALHVGRHLVVVADGLGGHVSGEVASAAAVEAIRAFDRPAAPDELVGRLARAVAEANAALRRRIEAEPELAGMGTTLVALTWSGSTAVLAHVGDSRAYLLRDGRLAQLTEDHQYRNLLSTAEQVPTLAERLTRFLDGRAEGVSADITTHELRAGDRWLLCTDGLSSYVATEVIHAALGADAGADEAADRLVALALEAGGHDNITVVVLDVLGEPAAATPGNR
jgi:PPM family protein phosphatase